MVRRILAGALWFGVTWYAWNFVVALTGMPEFVGPLLGIVALLVIALDPTHRIWTTPEARDVGESREMPDPAGAAREPA